MFLRFKEVGARRTRMQKKHPSYLLLFIIPCIFIFALSVARAWIGVETTDEALYYAEAILVNQGATPYVDVWQQNAGSFPLYGWLISLFSIFSPKLEGLFVYMRLMYCAFRALMMVAIYCLLAPRLKDNSEKGVLLASLLSVVGIWWGAWNGFSYNSLPMANMTLASVIIISEYLKNDDENPAYWKMYIVGILMALSTFSHITYFVGCFAVAFVILLCSPVASRRWAYTGRYLIGGIVSAFALVLYMLIKAGSIEYFITGIKGFLANTPYFALEHATSLLQQAKRVWSRSVSVFSPVLVVILISAGIYRAFCKRKIETNEVKALLLAGVVLGMMMYIGIRMFSAFRSCESSNSIVFYQAYLDAVWALAVIACLFWLLGLKYSKLNKVFLALFIPEAVLYAVQLVVTVGGDRSYLLAPTSLLVVPYVYAVERDILHSKLCKRILFALVSVLVLCVTLSANLYVYRDNSLPELNTRMDSTVYKGLYTTEEHAEALAVLHDYITEYSNEDDLIFCNEFNSCIFLLSNAKYCTFSTGGGCYEYGLVSDRILMEYMRITQKTPSVVVYASTWVKPKLSIDDADYELNTFFEENFDKVLDTEINDAIPRVVILRQK